MRLPSHDESSMGEASIGSLRCAPDIANPTSENELSMRRGDMMTLRFSLSDESDIQMVDR